MRKIQAVLSYNAMDYIASNHTSFQKVKAINAISSCRTSNAGSHSLTCECGHSKQVSNSCSNRHCPTCGGFSKELWTKTNKNLYCHRIISTWFLLFRILYVNLFTSIKNFFIT